MGQWSSAGGLQAMFAAAGPNVEFDPGSFDGGVTEEGLREWNQDRIRMGEVPMYYRRLGPGKSIFSPGELPAGVTPRQYSPRERLGIEAKRMNDSMAAGWPKP